MQATLTSRQSSKPPAVRATKVSGADPVAEGIFPSIAVRDLLLAEAEELSTEASLHRVWMANESAERCLEPARPPCQAHSLPTAEANRAALHGQDFVEQDRRKRAGDDREQDDRGIGRGAHQLQIERDRGGGDDEREARRKERTEIEISAYADEQSGTKKPKRTAATRSSGTDGVWVSPRSFRIGTTMPNDVVLRIKPISSALRVMPKRCST